MDLKLRTGQGPFTADMIREGDRYELERGHALYAAPGGGEHGRTSGIGYSVLASDPLVEEAGIDVGYVTEPGSLRAPDVAIGNVPDRPGWVSGAPPLAVEYASIGQDEDELAGRIRQLMAAGTQFVWVVRLKIPRHVEVHTPDGPVQIVVPGDHLRAPGILANPVPVEALWDGRRAAEVTLRNLLSRQGYDTLEEVRRASYEEGREEGLEKGREEGLEKGREEGLEKGREEGLEKGREEGLEKGHLASLRASVRQVFAARFGEAAALAVTGRLESASKHDLQRWLTSAATATDPAAALPEP